MFLTTKWCLIKIKTPHLRGWVVTGVLVVKYCPSGSTTSTWWWPIEIILVNGSFLLNVENGMRLCFINVTRSLRVGGVSKGMWPQKFSSTEGILLLYSLGEITLWKRLSEINLVKVTEGMFVYLRLVGSSRPIHDHWSIVEKRGWDDDNTGTSI